jgi:hypothetical protein
LKLFQNYCGYRAAIHCLLAIAGITGIGVRDPCLVVPELEHLGAEFRAEPTADAEIHINFWGGHNYSFLIVEINFREFKTFFTYTPYTLS